MKSINVEGAFSVVAFGGYWVARQRRCFSADINGVLARFTERTSVERQVVAIITDGRQNCGTTEIKPVKWQRGVAVVIVVVPGTENDGFNDYESRKNRFAAACPWCVIVPYYREDVDAVIAEAVKKSEGLTPNE